MKRFVLFSLSRYLKRARLLRRMMPIYNYLQGMVEERNGHALQGA